MILQFGTNGAPPIVKHKIACMWFCVKQTTAECYFFKRNFMKNITERAGESKVLFFDIVVLHVQASVCYLLDQGVFFVLLFRLHLKCAGTELRMLGQTEALTAAR